MSFLTSGQVFNLKLDSFAQWQYQCMAYTWSLLELKTQPRFCPVKWVCPLFNKCKKMVQKWNFFKFESRQKQCLIIQFIWKPFLLCLLLCDDHKYHLFFVNSISTWNQFVKTFLATMSFLSSPIAAELGNAICNRNPKSC